METTTTENGNLIFKGEMKGAEGITVEAQVIRTLRGLGYFKFDGDYVWYTKVEALEAGRLKVHNLSINKIQANRSTK